MKFDAFEWALEKATELGVNRIVPLAAARSEKGLLSGCREARGALEENLVRSFAASRDGCDLPVIESVAAPKDAFAAANSQIKLMLSERPEAQPLRKVLDGRTGGRPWRWRLVRRAAGRRRNLLAAGKAGFEEASLGSLILRTETAVTACLASVNYALDREPLRRKTSNDGDCRFTEAHWR